MAYVKSFAFVYMVTLERLSKVAYLIIVNTGSYKHSWRARSLGLPMPRLCAISNDKYKPVSQLFFGVLIIKVDWVD